MVNSPFVFADAASARQRTTDLAMKLVHEKVAIIGVGGTGSYILDFVAKTWVKEIHLFDSDMLLQHNLFRAPGAFIEEGIEGTPNKALFHRDRYSQMHGYVVGHPVDINEDSISLLKDFTTIFLCIDGGYPKRSIINFCATRNILVIDCGMGVQRVKDNQNLIGTLRVTTILPDAHGHLRDCIDFSSVEDLEDEYNRNIQMAELNALNAALAVIKWKKIKGIYGDQEGELHSLYVLDGNRLINRYEASE